MYFCIRVIKRRRSLQAEVVLIGVVLERKFTNIVDKQRQRTNHPWPDVGLLSEMLHSSEILSSEVEILRLIMVLVVDVTNLTSIIYQYRIPIGYPTSVFEHSYRFVVWL